MATVRDRKLSIVNRGLRLLQECKVPRFSAADPAELEQLQYAWSEQQVHLLTRLLLFLERHRQTLFEQDWGPVTGEFRKHFVLIYFEQVAIQFERAQYQAELDDPFALETWFLKFEEDVDCILTKESNSALRSWLFHHYGCVLGTEGWQNQPGEVYSFVRLSCFLVDSEWKTNVHLGSRVLSFAETFGLRLMGDRQNRDYRVLGIWLMNAVMRYTCKNHVYTSNAEEILELSLRLVRKNSEETQYELFNIVYYSARCVWVPNPSLDDEVMRTLVYRLIEDDSNVGREATYMRTLIRILLLEVPQVQMDELDYETFTIYGRVSNGHQFRTHVMQRFQCNAAPLDCRFSIRWKFRIGQLMPQLLGRIITSVESCYTERSSVQGLGVLVWLVMFPIGHTWRQKYARSVMFCAMLDELFNALNKLLQTLDDLRNEYNAVELQTQHILHRDLLALFFTIVEGTNVLANECLDLKQPCLNRYAVRIRAVENSLKVKMIGVHLVMQQILDALIRLVCQ